MNCASLTSTKSADHMNLIIDSVHTDEYDNVTPKSSVIYEYTKQNANNHTPPVVSSYSSESTIFVPYQQHLRSSIGKTESNLSDIEEKEGDTANLRETKDSNVPTEESLHKPKVNDRSKAVLTDLAPSSISAKDLPEPLTCSSTSTETRSNALIPSPSKTKESNEIIKEKANDNDAFVTNVPLCATKVEDDNSKKITQEDKAEKFCNESSPTEAGLIDAHNESQSMAVTESVVENKREKEIIDIAESYVQELERRFASRNMRNQNMDGTLSRSTSNSSTGSPSSGAKRESDLSIDQFYTERNRRLSAESISFDAITTPSKATPGSKSQLVTPGSIPLSVTPKVENNFNSAKDIMQSMRRQNLASNNDETGVTEQPYVTLASNAVLLVSRGNRNKKKYIGVSV